MTVMTVMTVEKLTPTVGAEVIGVDCNRLVEDEALPAWTLETLEEHGVLVFRGLHLDDATQVAFSKRLGRVEVLGKGEHPEIYRIILDPTKNPHAEYLQGTFDWHIDGMTEDIPIMASLLAAHAIATSGGETEFASTYAAYDDLTDEEKERFAEIRVVHSLAATQRLRNPNPTPEEEALWRKRPAKVHPLDDLLARATVPDRVYRHAWEVGDLVIWDNRGVLHRALPYDPTSPRDMHRTTLYGDEAVQ